jgi:hypothetical protein
LGVPQTLGTGTNEQPEENTANRSVNPGEYRFSSILLLPFYNDLRAPNTI